MLAHRRFHFGNPAAVELQIDESLHIGYGRTVRVRDERYVLKGASDGDARVLRDQASGSPRVERYNPGNAKALVIVYVLPPGVRVAIAQFAIESNFCAVDRNDLHIVEIGQVRRIAI